MKLFLDTSVLLAAANSATGSSRAIFDLAPTQNWQLISCPYSLNEVRRNLPRLPAAATTDWQRLRPRLVVHEDVLSLNRPVIFSASKDRPILFSALAWADFLLTLDKGDFHDLLGGEFYGLKVCLPYDFLAEERGLGRLKTAR